jgi:hypothetical protein
MFLDVLKGVQTSPTGDSYIEKRGWTVMARKQSSSRLKRQMKQSANIEVYYNRPIRFHIISQEFSSSETLTLKSMG